MDKELKNSKMEMYTKETIMMVNSMAWVLIV